MTLREKIEVMEAFERCEEIEGSYQTQDIWDYKVVYFIEWQQKSL